MCDTTNFFPWLEMQDGQLLLSAYLLCANMADLTYIKYTWFWAPILKCSPLWPFFLSKEFTGACANEIITSINRSFVYKAKEGVHVRIIIIRGKNEDVKCLRWSIIEGCRSHDLLAR